MKSTKAFMVTSRVFHFEPSDWKDDRLEIPLEPGTKVAAFLVFKWKGKERHQMTIPADLEPDKLVLKSSAKWEGCVTMFFHGGI